jgi:predicted P-loop ATPase
MKKDEQDQIKDVGGFVGGHLKEGRRKNGHVVNRSIVTLDVDFATPDLWEDIELLTDYAMVVYSTHKHKENKPRYRLIIPLAEPVGPEAYEAIARMIADNIGMDYFDDTTYQPTRLMYWPSTSKDGEYFYQFIDAPILDPNKVLAQYHDWKDVSYWPESTRAAKTRKRTAEKQGDPLEKEGLIGAFCRTYDIHEAIATFLPDTYQECSTADRYTYIGGSTAAGLVIYDDKFAYSNHGTDPISGQLCNAFDLVRIHKFGDHDLDAKDNTPVNKLPSWQKMMELIQADKKVKITIGSEKLEQAREEFGDDLETPEDESREWLSELTTNKQGKYEETIDNMLIILRNDPNLKGIGAHNLFSDRNEVKRELPWIRSGDYWSDIDDAGLRHYMERVYELQGRQKLTDALSLVFEENAYHPVKDYLSKLKWDKTHRLETIFCEYLGAEDTPYTRAVTRKTLVAAVSRIFRPGCKFDYMLTLIGKQGIGKSYIIKKLAMQWFSDSITDIKGKEAYEALDGVWLMEMGELAALKKSEREAIKGYISKQEDTYRKAFARNVTVNKRQCIFIGTTNDSEFLNDPTGGRRFWIIETDEKKRTKTVWDDMTQDEVDQIWAEAMHYYKKGENIMHLEKDIADKASALQSRHSQHNNFIGIIEEYLLVKLPEDWNEKNIQERKQWIQATEDFRAEEDTGRLVERTRVCALEVWCEAMGKDVATLTNMISRQINEAIESLSGWTRDKYPKKYGVYGSQRGFIKEGGGYDPEALSKM